MRRASPVPTPRTPAFEAPPLPAVDATSRSHEIERTRLSSLGWVRSADVTRDAPVQLYAYATRHAVESYNLLASAQRVGIPAAVVGTATPWRGDRGRMEAMRDLATAHVAAGGTEDLLVFLDAYDSVCARGDASDPRGLAADIVACGAPIVVGASSVRGPPVRGLPPPRSADAARYRYAANGFLAGRAGALAEALAWCAAQGLVDGAAALCAYAAAFPGRVTLDTERALVWNMGSAAHEVPPLTQPWFLHFPGAASDARQAAALRAAYVAQGGPRAILGPAERGHGGLREAVASSVPLLVVLLVLVAGLAAVLIRSARAGAPPSQAGQGGSSRAAAAPAAAGAAPKSAHPMQAAAGGRSGSGGAAAIAALRASHPHLARIWSNRGSE